MVEYHRQLSLDFTGATHSGDLEEADLKSRAELAVGEYLARGRQVWPQMPIARLLKALARQRIPADVAPRALELIGAHVFRIPEYVAKYNYRVTFTQEVLDRCRQAYQERGEE